MAIDDIKPVEPMKGYIGNDQGQGGKRSSYGGTSDDQQRYPSSPKRGIHDVTSFMGIPEGELTPAVTDAIIALMEEVDDLREQITHTQSLEHMLSDNVDNHADLPVLTRHALVREVMIVAGHVQRTGTASTFVYFQIKNSSVIKNRYGLLAYEAVLREAAEILKDQLRETDHVGTLGGDGFGIVLALSDIKTSHEKIRQLVHLVEQGPIMHDGRVLDVEVAYGLHAIHEGENATIILDAADKDLHQRFVKL